MLNFNLFSHNKQFLNEIDLVLLILNKIKTCLHEFSKNPHKFHCNLIEMFFPYTYNNHFAVYISQNTQ